jgi:pimeloyl-ACP methyl ester carboxylesterase
MIPKPHRRNNVAVPLGGVLKHMAVHEWGDEKNPRVVICVHGLSRNGRDFDVLADALSRDCRVLCPDIPGRGESDWLASAEQYAIPVYAQFIAAMLTEFGIKQYDWVGTSMGGLIGMLMAVTPGNAMRKFVINDVGPVIERVALDRIGNYVGRNPIYPSYEALFAAAQPFLSTFGPLSEEEQHHMIGTSVQRRTDGQWEYKMDPKIGDAFRATLAAPEVDLWPLWNAVKQPALILRGAQSDLLSVATLEKMLGTHPNARAITLEKTGHAPALMDAPTVAAIQQFLSEPA